MDQNFNTEYLYWAYIPAQQPAICSRTGFFEMAYDAVCGYKSS